MKFAGICLITKDVPALAEFYAKVFGITAHGDDVHAELSIEGVNIAIFSKEGMERMVPLCMQGAGCGSFTIGFEVKDVDAEYERLKILGVEFVKLPTTHHWGCRSLWFRDLEGNIIDFMSFLTD